MVLRANGNAEVLKAFDNGQNQKISNIGCNLVCDCCMILDYFSTFVY